MSASATPSELVWVEVDVQRLEGNMRRFRALVGDDVLLAPTVKANAYGHGLVLAAQAFLAGGADWLCVNALYEARSLREAGIDCPLYVLGPVAPAELDDALKLDCRLVAYDSSCLERLASLASPEAPAKLHLKLETGTSRQGLEGDEALAFARSIVAEPSLSLEGVSMHFANVEDTTDHGYAIQQLQAFEAFIERAAAEGIRFPIRHCTNTAALLLWPHTWFELVRFGIGAYGMWPSKETRVAAQLLEREDVISLQPALTWKTRVAQVKELKAGTFVGYGLTYRCTHDTRLAVLPSGYYDGYDRSLSNQAYVLIRGHRAPVRGRVCMNLTMVDVTHVPGASVGDEVVLLGPQGEDAISCEQMAEWAGTINYEVTTRINERVPRLAAGSS